MKDIMPEKKLTLDDVALRAGVSVSTVSRVVNNSMTVSQDLAERVRQAMRDVGFEPEARTRKKPYIVGFITPDSGEPTSAAIIAGAHDEANRLGLCLNVMNVTEDPSYQPHNLELLKHLSFDGLVIDHAHLDPEKIVSEYHLNRLPVAVITPFIDSPRFYCVSCDRESGMYQAAKYLLSLNHREIAYIAGVPELEISQSRLRGITRPLAEAGLQLAAEYSCQGPTGIEVGFEAAMSIFSHAGERRPTALIAYNDLMAIGAMHAIRTYGLSIPQDISVIGFNEMYFTPHTNPPLTTISQPAHREGQLAIQKIYHHLQGWDAANKGTYTLLECRLVVRESTAPCKMG